MDPMTQSAQISSSQGLADGHNSAAKESKLSDSFLSSSPVSLIQSPQDKRVDSDKNSELVKTPLHVSSQSASSPPGNCGSQSDEAPDSPVKTSPVSERIKALEALVAKKKEPDFRSEGYSHYRDRHTDKRSSIEIQKAAFEKNEKTTSTAQKKGSSSDKESPDSPFEILGDYKPLKELEDTEEWMKAHLPSVTEFQSSDDIPKELPVTENVSSKQERVQPTPGPDAPVSFAGVPDAFMDSPVKGESFDDATVPQNPYAEEECDFDLSFLPTAYMCNQQEKNFNAVVAMSPPAGFESTSPERNEKTQFTADPDPPEAPEVDSSGESDDTVIEDGVPVHASAALQSTKPQQDVDSASTPCNAPEDEKEAPPVKSERKLMQVPTINVIETDEPNYSDEEMELEVEEEEEEEKGVNLSKDQDVKMSDTTIPESCVERVADKHPVDNQFVEGYSPTSSPVESDTEFSPKHKVQELSHEVVDKGPQEPHPVDDYKPQSKDHLPDKEPFDDFSDHEDEWGDQTMDLVKPISATPDPSSFTTYKTDEKAKTETTEAPLEAHNPKSSFMKDEIYDRESFDYDYDAQTSPADDGEDSEPELGIDQPYTNPFLVKTEQNASQSAIKNDNDDNQDVLSKRYPQDPYSIFYTAPVSSSEPDVDNRTQKTNLDDNCNTIKGQASEPQHTEREDLIPETKADPDDLDPTSNSEPADSFVEFMRECLKSRQDEETHRTEDCVTSNILLDAHSSPSVVTDLEQEKLTISALKELGSSQEEELEPPLQSVKQYEVEPKAQSPCPPNTQPTSSQSNPAPDSLYAREVEAIDEWVAEAYHLAEHVLTAVLTHLSVKDLIHWRDPKKSGVVFGVSMLMLLSLAAFSVISVISYLLLALLCVTITFRIYKSVVQAVQKSSDGHPFKSLIEKDVSIPPETFRKHVDASLTYINRALKQLSRLFLVEDLVDSLKLAVVMWLFTYVGAVFNGITILILADILLFAVPPVYEKNKTQIDQYIDLVRTQINSTMAKLQEKLPGSMKRTKSE